MKALVGAFNQEKALVGAFSVIVKTGSGTDGSFYSTNSDIVTVSLAASSSGHVARPAETRQILDLNKYLMSRLPADSRPGDRSHNNHTNYICTAIPVSSQVRNNLRFKKILFIISSISTKIASLRSVKG